MYKPCYFCKNNLEEIDWKNTEILRRFLTGQAKIASPKRTGACRKHQRILTHAIKRARFIALLPYTTR